MARPNDVNADAFLDAEKAGEASKHKSFEDMGFKSAAIAKSRRLVMLVYGLEGTGKTHFALTAPGPIAIFDFDDGLQDMVDKFTKKKEVFRMGIKKPMGNYKDEDGEWMKILADFRRKYIYALKKARTVIIDTGGELWETTRAAHNEGSINSTEYGYTRPNAEMRWVVEKARSQNKANVIILQKARKQYEVAPGSSKGNWNGKWEPDGWKHMPFEVQVTAYLERDEDEDNDLGITILKCRPREAMMGKQFWRSDLKDGKKFDFPFLAMKVLKGTNREDWA